MSFNDSFPKLSETYNSVWGIQDDVDEDDLVEQVVNKCSVPQDKASLKRKIYRHRVLDTNSWEHLNKEKFVAMPINLIPQKQSPMSQVVNNRLNDSWNEPTVIKVLIIQEELKPTQSDFVLELMEMGQETTKIILKHKDLHPDNSYNWQFGIDKMQNNQFKHNWLNLVRLE